VGNINRFKVYMGKKRTIEVTLGDRLLMAIKFLMMHFYYRIDRFVIESASKMKKGRKLLDVGAGDGKHRRWFKHLRYESCDLVQNQTRSIDYVGDFEKGIEGLKAVSYDYVLCIQVLEHTRNPSVVYRRINELLKPGGRLFLTTNFIYQMHMLPNDYYRFTEYGLKTLGEESGFRVVSIKPQGGMFGVLAYLITTIPLRVGLDRMRWSYWLYLILFSPAVIVINLMGIVLDVIDKKKLLTINYEVIYEKK